jgi:2-polyprenyl-3-methyl-5-hydroxy-6-metoxy-1,4-benzoquinol methylase
MNRDNQEWRTYEEVATHLLNEFARHFGLGRVEGKQVVPGRTGAEWEIDAKGVLSEGIGFVVVECRRRTKSRIDQEQVAALAYRITDVGATGGILVTPLDLQAGARVVATAANVRHVKLKENSTTTNYILEFLNQVFLGVSDELSITISESASVVRFDGDKPLAGDA